MGYSRRSSRHRSRIKPIFFSAPACRHTTGRAAIARRRRTPDENTRGGVRHRNHAIALQMKTFDGRAADGFRRRDHHGRQAQAQQHGSAIANAIGFGVPGRIQPRREIVQRHHARPQRQIGDREIGAMKDVDPEARDLALQSPGPPAPFQHVARPVARTRDSRATNGSVVF